MIIRNFETRLFAILSAILISMALRSQVPTGNQPGQEVVNQEQAPPIRVVVEEVSVQFIVTDKSNRFLTDLRKEDFQVLEDNKPQEILSFSRESDLPLRIALLIDTSNSVRDRFAFEQQASADFLRSLLRQGKDKAMLGSFDSMAELVQDFTDDTDTLVSGIQSLRPGGGTALYDALFYACRDRLRHEAPPQSIYRRAIIVLSDGEDNQSRTTRKQALEMAQRAEVTIYTITTNIRGAQMPGDKILREFSEQTGGRYFQPRSWEELDETFLEIEQELRSQYSISYRSTSPRDTRFHGIRIIPTDENLRVRARQGYFAVSATDQSNADKLSN
jgi:Ca-activated chloride channel homolog